MKKLVSLCHQITKDLQRQHKEGHILDEDLLRDHCDWFSGQELDCQPLDILTDMVKSRLRQKGIISAKAEGQP